MRHSPVAELQIFAVPSFDAVSTEAPSVENTAEVMTSSCPASVRKHSHVAELQIFAVLSFDVVSTEAPLAENIAEVMSTSPLA